MPKAPKVVDMCDRCPRYIRIGRGLLSKRAEGFNILCRLCYNKGNYKGKPFDNKVLLGELLTDENHARGEGN